MRGWLLVLAVIGMIVGLLPTPLLRVFTAEGQLTPAVLFDGILWALGGACLAFAAGSIVFRFLDLDLSEHFFCWLGLGVCWLGAIMVHWWSEKRQEDLQKSIFELYDNWDGLVTAGAMLMGLGIGYGMDKIRHKLRKE